jgi:hypothetical protein
LDSGFMISKYRLNLSNCHIMHQEKWSFEGR